MTPAENDPARLRSAAETLATEAAAPIGQRGVLCLVDDAERVPCPGRGHDGARFLARQLEGWSGRREFVEISAPIAAKAAYRRAE